MTYNEVKELLESVRRKKSRLNALQLYITEQRALIENLGAVDYEAIRVKATQGNSTEARYARYIERLSKLQEEFANFFDEMCEDEDKLSAAMVSLNPQEYEVILNRYMRGLTRSKTAKVMGYTIDGIKSATSRAIKKMSKK